MYEKLEKIFIDDRVFTGAAITSAVGFILHAECALMPAFSDFPGAMNYLLCGGCMLAMLISYRRHSKNVMKGMMGALLAISLSNAFNAADTAGGFDVILSWVSIVSLGALFINHFLINSTHYSSPQNIRINQMLVLAVMAVDVCRFVQLLAAARTTMDSIDALLFLLGDLPFAAAVICIESRLDLYRAQREAAGFDPDKREDNMEGEENNE